MVGTFQPQWGQTSCWSCPPNTSTDSAGSRSVSSCKTSHCTHHSSPGLAILQSPNYPSQLPSNTRCHWAVQGEEGGSLLIILPSLSLPPHCTHTLSVRRREEEIFSSCSSLLHPVLLTTQGGQIWVDLSTTETQPSSIEATGFMISLITVPDDLIPVIQAVLDQGHGEQVDRIRNNIWGNTLHDRQLVNHLMKLLSPPVRDSTFDQRELKEKTPLIEVVEESENTGFKRLQKGGSETS